MPNSPADSSPETQARFNALVLPHLDRLLAFAARRTESLADAEDAVQEACVRAWSAFADLRDETRVRAWLYRILRSVLIDASERRTRRRQLVSITRLEDAHESLVGGGVDDLFDEVAARITGEALREALGRIPEDFAVAIELHDIDGFKYHEIAEITHVPIGTVMSRISRGRRLLAGAMLASGALATPAATARRAPGGAKS